MTLESGNYASSAVKLSLDMASQKSVVEGALIVTKTKKKSASYLFLSLKYNKT